MTNMVMSGYDALCEDCKYQQSESTPQRPHPAGTGGEEVIVCQRGRPVVRIVPYRAEDYREQEQRLIARGTIAPA
jgi:hypothetical protein